MSGTKFLAHKMSQNIDSGTGSQFSKYNTACWRWKIITSQLLMLLYDELWNIYDKLSLIAQDILAAPASQAYIERVFLCAAWSQKQNDQVIANASLFETEQKSIGEHGHQCLCVNFGTLTLMEINCK